MKAMTKTIFTLSAVLLASLAMPAAQGATRATEDTAKDTLRDVKSQAFAAMTTADTLEMMISAAKVSSETQSNELMALREELNRAGKDIATLEADRDELSAWEQQALDRIVPLIKDAAENTTLAIQHFNANRTHLWGREDLAYADKVYKDSGRAADLLNSYLNYEKLRNEEAAVASQISTGMND